MTELISVGGYGCVYRPNINCDGSTGKNPKFISKLQVHNESSINELYIANKLKKYDDVFVLPQEKCEINKKMIKISDCPLIAKHSNLLLIKMNYINNKSFFDLLTEDDNLERQIYVLLYNYGTLIKSLYILKENNILHYDLKLDNILYDIDAEYPKIIDFGISLDTTKISLTNLRKTFWIYAPWYYVWCPQIHFICYLVNVNATPKLSDIEELVHDYIKNNEILSLLDSKYLTEYEVSYVSYLSSFIGSAVKDVAKELLRHSSNWDIYSLGLIFIKLHKFVTKKNNIKHPFFDFFMDILKSTIHPDPRNNLTEKEIMKLLYDYTKEKKIETTIKNKGFTPQYVSSIKKYHKSHWNKIDNKLMECSLQKIE